MHIVSGDWKLVPSVCYFTWENPDNLLSCGERESCWAGGGVIGRRGRRGMIGPSSMEGGGDRREGV